METGVCERPFSVANLFGLQVSASVLSLGIDLVLSGLESTVIVTFIEDHLSS